MKKMLSFFMVLVIVLSMQTASLAAQSDMALPDNAGTSNVTNTEDNRSASSIINDSVGDDEKINNTLNTAGNTAMSVGQNILDQITTWCLPFCAILVIWGAVQYFILGIRNLYKKRQGLLLMWGSMTFYVVALFINLILTFMGGK